MQLSTKDANDIFGKLGFILFPCTHHVRGYLEVDGKSILTAHFSHGKKNMPGSVAHKFRKQLKLSITEFDKLRRGKMSRKDYIELLRRKGTINS